MCDAVPGGCPAGGVCASGLQGNGASGQAEEQKESDENDGQIFSGDVHPEGNRFSGDIMVENTNNASVQCTVDDLKKIGEVLFGSRTILGEASEERPGLLMMLISE